MNLTDTTEIIFIESLEGLAVTSREDKYPTKNEAMPLLQALSFIYKHLQDEDIIERKLAASLFVLNDQVQGNMLATKAKGLDIPKEFSDEVFPQINDLIYAIFEDWDEDGD